MPALLRFSLNYVTLSAMTPKQKRIIATLAVANGIVILTLVVLVARPFGTMSSLPSTTPTYLPNQLPYKVCERKATQELARTGLGGSVTLTPGGALGFDLVYPLAPRQSADDVAQHVWDAFDVALALVKDRCDVFSRVEVLIVARGDQRESRVRASVSVMDLKAFSASALSEEAFIERVSFTTTTSGDR